MAEINQASRFKEARENRILDFTLAKIMPTFYGEMAFCGFEENWSK